MPEYRALLGLLALAVAGHGVRLALVPSGAAPGAVELLPAQPGRTASAATHRDSIKALSRPLAPGQRIDLDRAPVLEIARLPRVGVALAKRIVADRTARGPFGSLTGLDRVPGVGPGLLRALEPHVAFSGHPMSGGAGGQMSREVDASHSTAGQRLAAPAHRPIGFSAPLDLNAASAAQLDSLPGIGPARAAAIVQYRARHGPFSSLADLARVPGINPALVQRLHDRLRVP